MKVINRKHFLITVLTSFIVNSINGIVNSVLISSDKMISNKKIKNEMKIDINQYDLLEEEKEIMYKYIHLKSESKDNINSLVSFLHLKDESKNATKNKHNNSEIKPAYKIDLNDTNATVNSLGFIKNRSEIEKDNIFNDLDSCDQIYSFNITYIPDMKNVTFKKQGFMTMSAYLINIFETKNNSRLINSINLHHIKDQPSVIQGSNFCMEIKSNIGDDIKSKNLNNKNIKSMKSDNKRKTFNFCFEDSVKEQVVSYLKSNKKDNKETIDKEVIKAIKNTNIRFNQVLKTFYQCRLGYRVDKKNNKEDNREVIKIGDIIAGTCFGGKIYKLNSDVSPFKSVFIDQLKQLGFNVKT